MKSYWAGSNSGVVLYAAQFDGSAKIRGDTSPRYTNDPLDPGVAERMADVLPTAKLLYIVRDPVERIVSHYTHYLAAGYENRDLSEALEGLDQDPSINPYLCRSLYHQQLKPYLRRYAKSQIHVLYYEDLRDRPRDALAKVFAFLGVAPMPDNSSVERIYHQTSSKRRLTPFGKRVDGWLKRPLSRLSQDARVEVVETLTRPFSAAVVRPEVSADLETRLRNALSEDGRKLEAFVGRPAPWSP